MYPTTTMPYGFNHQSSYRQPISNLQQINNVVWNQSNGTQQTNNVQLNGYSTVPNQLRQTYSAPKETNDVGQQSNVSVANTSKNYIESNLLPLSKVNNQTVQQLKPTNVVSNLNQNQTLVRQSSIGTLPNSRHVSSRESTPLSNSRSMGTLHHQILRERRSHTMAPVSRITGPSLLMTGNLFASTVAPNDARTINAAQTTQIQSNIQENHYLPSENQKTNAIAYGDTENDAEDEDEEDEEEDEDDEEEDVDEDEDDAPIIVKVRYDPNMGGPPPEDLIRQAIDNKLKAQSNSQHGAEPIILNFLDKVQIPNDKVVVTPQQPAFNRSNPSIPQQFIQTQQQTPTSVLRPQLKQQNLTLLQQRHQQHQQLLHQQQRQQQQLQQQKLQQQRLEQQRLQQQQLQQHQLQKQQLQQQQLQQQKLEQQRLQQHKLQQQKMEQQRLHQQKIEQQKLQQQRLQQQKLQEQRLQQQKLEQQRLEKQKLEQQRLQQQKLEQQRRQQLQFIEKQQKEKQQLSRYLQQTQNDYNIEQERNQRLLQLDNQRIRQQVAAEQSEINKLISQQLRQERQQHEHQKQQQLFQQQKTRSQTVHQRRPPVYPQQQQPQYASLPPIGPRSSRSLSSMRPIPINQPSIRSQQNNTFYLPQHSQSGIISSRNPQYNHTVHTSRVPNIPIMPVNNLFTPGPGLYASLSYQNLPHSFAPIQTNGSIQQQYATINNNKSLPDLSKTLPQRPHTAPSSTELFRTPSALDIPELSKENLSSMLGKIPDLSGLTFSIEYAEPNEPINIPIPSQTDGDNDKYPEAVIVDELPNNILQHVSSSDNLELRSALAPALEQAKNFSTKEQPKRPLSKLKDSVSKVLHHKARPKHSVKDSRVTTPDESDSTSETSSSSYLSSEEETEFEETVIENFAYTIETH